MRSFISARLFWARCAPSVLSGSLFVSVCGHTASRCGGFAGYRHGLAAFYSTDDSRAVGNLAGGKIERNIKENRRVFSRPQHFVNTLSRELDHLNPELPTYVLCQGGYRSSLCTSILENAGFKEI